MVHVIWKVRAVLGLLVNRSPKGKGQMQPSQLSRVKTAALMNSLNFHEFLQSTVFQSLKSLECIYSTYLYETAVSLPSLLGVQQI